MGVYSGHGGLVYLSTDGTGAAASVGKISKWSLDRTSAMTDATGMDDPNLTYVHDKPDFKGTLSAFWDDTVDTFFTGSASTNGVKMYIYPSSLVLTKYWYAPVHLSINGTSGGIGTAVALDIAFAANGAAGRK